MKLCESCRAPNATRHTVVVVDDTNSQGGSVSYVGDGSYLVLCDTCAVELDIDVAGMLDRWIEKRRANV